MNNSATEARTASQSNNMVTQAGGPSSLVSARKLTIIGSLEFPPDCRAQPGAPPRLTNVLLNLMVHRFVRDDWLQVGSTSEPRVTLDSQQRIARCSCARALCARYCYRAQPGALVSPLCSRCVHSGWRVPKLDTTKLLSSRICQHVRLSVGTL